MSVNKEYRLLTQVPIGTEMIYKPGCSYARKCVLLEIRNFPTRFKVQFEDNTTDICLTHEVKVLWEKEEEISLDSGTPNPYGDDDFATP